MLKRDWTVYAITWPRRAKKLPVVLSVEEVHRVLNGVQQPAQRVCLSTIYSCGLRLGEGVPLLATEAVVHSQPLGYGVKAVEYLADYIFRVGISNSRIVKLANDEVTFWYRQ